jgi:Outer membrane receptor for ferrienterochelin and colicins
MFCDFHCRCTCPGDGNIGRCEVERVIVTGSNIPTAEERAESVDTYRPADLEKLGIRNCTGPANFSCRRKQAARNLNIGNGGDGTVQINLRGLLPKETLILIDGKRFAYGSLGSAGLARVRTLTSFPSR